MITGILGPDGSGKTTMIRRLAGLLPPAGEVRRVEGRIGYLPQKFGLYGNLSVMENIELYARLNGVDRSTMRSRSAALLKAVNMDRFATRAFGKLSGGMKQKAALVCALIARPDVLLLDEPTVGVDVLSRRELWSVIQQFQAENPAMQVFVSTTYADEEGYCDRVIRLQEEASFSPPQRQNPVAPQAPEIVRATDLVKRFGSFTAVDHISFGVRRGEVFGLLGANGAGKTTTFRMLCGLDPVTEGEVSIDGVDLRKASSEALLRLGFVAQKFSLYPELTVEENLRFFGGAYRLEGERLESRLRWACEEFRLGEYVKRAARSLPLGLKQRLAMAAALLHEPPILFLDEATSGADARTRHDFWVRILALADRGVSVVVTTHYLDEADYCDRMIVMQDGRARALGTVEEIKRQGGGQTFEEAFVNLIRRNGA